MNRFKIIEVMAAAICGPNTPCEACRNSAERAFSALQAQGLAVVTMEPTREMMIAGLQSMTQRVIHSGCPEIIYRAMLAASNSPKEESDE